MSDIDTTSDIIAVSTPKEESIKKDQNVTMHFNYTFPKREGSVLISLPAIPTARVQEIFGNVLDKQLLDNKDSREWGSTIKDALNFATSKGVFIETLLDPNSDFEQFIESNGEQLNGRSPRFKKAENENLKGSRAVMRVLEKRKLGGLYQTPLWNTGIWITFKPPADSSIVELNRQLASDKIELGRNTYGLVYSNTSVYTVNRLVDFALKHVQDTTLKMDNINALELKKTISTQDIPLLLWGVACAMYPAGFNYRRACSTNPEKCQHIAEELLNLSKLLWVNKNGLTDWQKNHMVSRTPSIKTFDDIKRYKEELKATECRKYTLEEGFDIFLKTPVIEDYVNAGFQWVDSIVALVEETAGSDLTSEEKNSLILRHGQATGLKQYSHWVSKLELDSNIIDDPETLMATFDALSSDEEIQEKFITHVSDYINKSTVSVIGIPEFNCPSCGTVQEGDKKLPTHASIIPLDVTLLFFALITERMEKIVGR